MKLAKVFAVFVLLHVLGWMAAHAYMNRQEREVLIVADTSFAMKPHFAQMEEWINTYAETARYKNVVVASDKALMGKLSDLRSTSQIFRANYGRIKEESLKKFESMDVMEKILLSDGSINPSGWTVVKFD